MDNFVVDGTTCRIDRLTDLAHTGSAPYCYDGDVIVEPGSIFQVFAEVDGHCITARYEDTDTGIVEKFTKYFRIAVERMKR